MCRRSLTLRKATARSFGLCPGMQIRLLRRKEGVAPLLQRTAGRSESFRTSGGRAEDAIGRISLVITKREKRSSRHGDSTCRKNRNRNWQRNGERHYLFAVGSGMAGFAG